MLPVKILPEGRHSLCTHFLAFKQEYVNIRLHLGGGGSSFGSITNNKKKGKEDTRIYLHYSSL
jgi:hypothetical protein